MNLSLLLDMAASAMPERVGIVAGDTSLTYADLARRALSAAQVFAATPNAERVVMVDLNSAAVPIALYGAAVAGVPFVPVNYRLTDEQLRGIVTRTAPAILIAGAGVRDRIEGIEGITIVDRDEFLERTRGEPSDAPPVDADPESIAVLLYTSGTTGEPKAAVLRHSNLASYNLSTIDLAAADEDEAALVSVPAYHIAGVSAVLSSGYAGRRIVYLESFDPQQWVAAVDRHGISASIGYALAPGDAQNLQRLLQLADDAMYCAKRRGKNCVMHASAA